jgi:hypothetical protein
MVCKVRILRIFVISILIIAGFGFGVSVWLWGYFNGHTLTTYKLSVGHTLRIIPERQFDIADSVLCQLANHDYSKAKPRG